MQQDVELGSRGLLSDALFQGLLEGSSRGSVKRDGDAVRLGGKGRGCGDARSGGRRPTCKPMLAEEPPQRAKHICALLPRPAYKSLFTLGKL